MDFQNSRNRGRGSSETRDLSYDVCLSFREQGTRWGFVDRLYHSLLRSDIRVFKDDEKRFTGRGKIEPSLLEASGHSKIAIPILSEDYPSSPWCLRDLAQMVESHKTTGQIIMPVFFNVTPSVVKNRSDGYGEAIAGHRRRGFYPNTLREWQEALICVGSIPGLEIDSSPVDASVIDVLVANVLRELNRNFVGIENHEERVMKLLKVDSSDVRVVGIHGIGGAGKTTIARFIYKRIFNLFDGCSFLENVREHNKKPGGLDNLQGQLVSDLLGVTHGQIHSVDDGIKSIRSRFLHKKVLIVLDDIEPSSGLTPILSILDSLGSGSRIIITTRDEQALDKFEVSLKYEVKGMREGVAPLLHGKSVAPAEVFDVYLSFGGLDTRKVFVDHLCSSLHKAGIRVVSNHEEERIGRPIPQSIRHSKIAIPILSKNYPSSSQCLRELAQIVEDHKTMGQIIMPVFLNVTPSVVKNISHGYREAIEWHRWTGVNPETLREWEEALIHVGSISGLTSNRLGTRALMINTLVANVLKVLKRRFVGIEHRVETVMKLLNVESSDVHVVGIHGIGGTGKTTIAKFVYKRIFHLFDGCSFLESFRENAKKPGGLVDLQGQLISDLLGAMHRQIPSVDDGIKSIRSRFFHKKVLIVFDDIERGFELTPILGSLDWLGSGSRIIITARAEQALDKLEVILKYEVGGMQQDEALTLFHIHAFMGEPTPVEFVTLSKKIVSTIDCLPLTIEVVGSYLFSKGKDVWMQTLDKLEKVPKLQVEQKLMVIIKALPDKQRQIFLDIACFFIGEDKSVACYLWSDYDSASGLELQVLVLSSIVKIENNKLWMHDQLRDLGRDIVQGEHREPGNRSRLWLQDEALDVLTNEKGTNSVQGVLLKFDSRSQCSFKPAHFASMSNIRFLRLDQANLEGKFGRRLSSLRWLHWQGCPRNLCAGNLDLKKLVILDLSWSKVNEKWNGWREIEKAKKLKVLNLTGCVDLIRTPNLSCYKNLERLILERCIRLVEIGSSIKSLEMLISLNLRSCTELNKLPEELGSLISLEEILIDGTAVQEIPASIGHLQKLRTFSACNCLSLIQLPDSINHVKSLTVFTLNGTKITELPLSEELEVLQHLSINHCRSILKLPTSLGSLASLIKLDLSSTGIVELPNTINKLDLLEVLKIDFTFVRELPGAIWKLKRLEELHASRCRSLAGEIPRDIEKLSRLKVLRLGYSRICGLPDSISRLPNLQMLDLLHCDKLHRVPKLPSTLISLSISSKLMDTIPDISRLVKLGELFLADGSQELVLPDQGQVEAKGHTYLELGSLSELKILQLSLVKIQLLPVGLHLLCKLTKLSLCCIHLTRLPQLPPGLFTLSLRRYKSWTGLPDLSYLGLLSEFELFDCAVTEVAGLGQFKSLQIFKISHCKLQQLDELENLIFLASLNVSYCQSLERLPHLSKLKKLKDIKIEGCSKIHDIKSVEHLHSFEKPSSAIIETESSSEMEFSKPASIQGIKCKDKGSSTTWHRVKAVASKFSCHMISRTKPTHSFPH